MHSTDSKFPFLFVSCQHGATTLLKSELCEPLGPFRLAYSCRGFLTLKSQIPVSPWTRALPEHPLIRSRGIVLGKIEGTDAKGMLEQALGMAEGLDWQVCHVWQRDSAQPGSNGFEPGGTALAWEIAQLLRSQLQERQDPRPVVAHRPADDPQLPLGGIQNGFEVLTRKQRVLDLIIDESNRWWLACKQAQHAWDDWPGGIPQIPIPELMLSRAYLKIAEAFAWSELQIRPGERIVEIGSSPGGACQWLLDQGAIVTGIDPAEMDERVLAHPNFTHWRGRSLQIKRKLFRPFRILVCDANVTPNYTLDTVGGIVEYPTTRLRALVLTIKLPEWEAFHKLPDYLERIRSWGYANILVRQLAHNRRELCVIARRKPGVGNKPLD